MAGAVLLLGAVASLTEDTADPAATGEGQFETNSFVAADAADDDEVEVGGTPSTSAPTTAPSTASTSTVTSETTTTTTTAPATSAPTTTALSSSPSTTADSPSTQVTTTQPPVTVSTTAAPTTQPPTSGGCHPAYSPCIPHLQGDALNCGDIGHPVTVLNPSVDPYELDKDNDGHGCESS